MSKLYVTLHETLFTLCAMHFASVKKRIIKTIASAFV